MLNIAETRYFQYTEKVLASTENADALVEGSPLVLKIEDGMGKVGLPTGAATDKFVGVAFAGFVRPSQLVAVEKFVVDADALTVKLAHTPAAAAQVGATYTTAAGVVTNATVQQDGAAAAGSPSFAAASNEMTFAAADAGLEYTVIYRYDATVNEARFVAGDGYPGGFQLSELAGTVGVIHQGQVATDQYETNVDWTSAGTADVKLSANGKFTIGGNGATVANARVLAVPGVKSEYLVLQLL